MKKHNNIKELLDNLENTIQIHNIKEISNILDNALEFGVSPNKIRQALVNGIGKARHQLMSNKVPIAEFLLCMDTMNEGLNKLAPLLNKENPFGKGIHLVIGVVEGDPHDLGKNIISGIYKAYGYEVFDLGRDVPKDTFIKKVQENNAKVLALSAMMSTTAVSMRDIINEVKFKFPDTLVIVGGAPFDKVLAMTYGADAYAESASTVIEETEAAIQKKV
jgi:5-methyltetrahydrofolate--homocysteine methyltransferase